MQSEPSCNVNYPIVFYCKKKLFILIVSLKISEKSALLSDIAFLSRTDLLQKSVAKLVTQVSV